MSETNQIKLLVNTANEAVEVLRDRYGEQARVLSVKQVEAEGLKRLISKPRLEVIVEVPVTNESPEVKKKKLESLEKPTPANTSKLESKPSSVSGENSNTEPPEAFSSTPNAVGNLYSKGSSSSANYFSDVEEEEKAPQAVIEPDPPAESAPLGSAANPVRRGTIDAVKRAISMLESVGFDLSLIERVRAEIDFKDIGSLPTMDLYAKICDWLRNQFPDTSSSTVGVRRAFVGCCGVGKTAALSKMLSNDVFIKGLSPTVLKVDSDIPNPSDGLEIFCDIMGASLVRSLDEVPEISAESPLIVDTPGYSLSDPASIDSCRETLNELDIDERILVINAAYEADLIAEMLAAGESIGATRVVFTHLDEARRAGKLWKFLLNGRIKPLFFSEGPNPAGDYTLDTYSYLLERSFPNGRALAAATRKGTASKSAKISMEESVNA